MHLNTINRSSALYYMNKIGDKRATNAPFTLNSFLNSLKSCFPSKIAWNGNIEVSSKKLDGYDWLNLSSWCFDHTYQKAGNIPQKIKSNVNYDLWCLCLWIPGKNPRVRTFPIPQRANDMNSGCRLTLWMPLTLT